MPPILIAGLVLVCLALLYYFDIFGVKKWADKTFNIKSANKFVPKFGPKSGPKFGPHSNQRPPVGSTVQCSEAGPRHGRLYRVMPKGIALYPSVDVAYSWDPYAKFAVKFDCTGESVLPEMMEKQGMFEHYLVDERWGPQLY